MAVLQAAHGAGERVDDGDAVLAAAKSVNTTLVKKRLATFASVHRAYSAAQTKTTTARKAVRLAEQNVANADVIQDERIGDLASALIGDGLPRTNPFKPLGFDAPSLIQKLGYRDEAKVVHELVAAVQKRKDLSPKTLAKAKALDAAATAVEKAIAATEPKQKAYDAARAARQPFGQQWETAFASLKRGARSAADDGAPELFDALFSRDPKPAKKKPAPAAAPTTQSAKKS